MCSLSLSFLPPVPFLWANFLIVPSFPLSLSLSLSLSSYHIISSLSFFYHNSTTTTDANGVTTFSVGGETLVMKAADKELIDNIQARK
jgi:hypothetical protein